jgi:uncharacterized membrane protein
MIASIFHFSSYYFSLYLLQHGVPERVTVFLFFGTDTDTYCINHISNTSYSIYQYLYTVIVENDYS